jgi:hypothetical protein
MDRSRSIAAVLLVSTTLAAQAGWQQLATASAPTPRNNALMAYDAMRDRMVVYGGSGNGSQPTGDTWELDGAAWTLRAFGGPPARSVGAMVYDERAARVVLFGGSVAQSVFFGPPLNDTWLWDGNAWTLANPVHAPSPRMLHAMAYDEARQRVVLFGGIANSTELDETWEWDGVDWTQMLPASRPPAMRAHAMTYDSVRGQTVLVGAYPFSSDCWAWNGVTWTQLPSLPSTADTILGPRVAFDRERGRCVLRRSRYASPSSTLVVGETWELDGAAWTLLPAGGQPPANTSVALAYDRRRGQVIQFGGSAGLNGVYGETWTLGVPGLAVAQPYGYGCGSPPLTATPDPTARPVLGGTQRVAIANAPVGFAAMAAGFSRDWFGGVPLPMPLSVIGMTGCQLLQSHDLNPLACTQTGPTTAEYTLPIPSAAALAGFTFFLQPWAFAPAEPGSLTIANAIAVTVGTL